MPGAPSFLPSELTCDGRRRTTDCAYGETEMTASLSRFYSPAYPGG